MTNRLLAITAARRLCARYDARCTIVWDWGDFTDFFSLPANAEVVKPAEVTRTGVRTVHLHLDPNPDRRLDLSSPRLEVYSNNVFFAIDEPRPKRMRDFVVDAREFIPTPSRAITELVDEFSGAHFGRTVGFHIRRTDHKQARDVSPDELFYAKASELIASGYNIFLATDNLDTESTMKRRFGAAIVTRPKRNDLSVRWPRAFDRVAAQDDLVDFFLLTRTAFIVGSHASTFSELAIVLNGSPQSSAVRLPTFIASRRTRQRIRARVERLGPFVTSLYDRRWDVELRRWRYVGLAYFAKFMPILPAPLRRRFMVRGGLVQPH